MAHIEELRRKSGILKAHRIIVANRQQGIVERILLADELHVAEQRRITGKVDDFAAHVDDVAAGHTACNACAVLRERHADLAERQRQRAAEVHRVLLEAGLALLAEREHLRDGDDGRSRAGRDLRRIAEMVAVRMADEDVVAVHISGSDSSFWVARQEWVEEYLVLTVIQQETRMAIIYKREHLFQLLSIYAMIIAHTPSEIEVLP